MLGEKSREDHKTPLTIKYLSKIELKLKSNLHYIFGVYSSVGRETHTHTQQLQCIGKIPEHY